jgi:hypothetical protein
MTKLLSGLVTLAIAAVLVVAPSAAFARPIDAPGLGATPSASTVQSASSNVGPNPDEVGTGPQSTPVAPVAIERRESGRSVATRRQFAERRVGFERLQVGRCRNRSRSDARLPDHRRRRGPRRPSQPRSRPARADRLTSVICEEGVAPAAAPSLLSRERTESTPAGLSRFAMEHCVGLPL